MRRILFQRCRSEKEYSDDGGGEMIGAILKAREARVANYRIFDRRVAAHGRSDDDDSDDVV